MTPTESFFNPVAIFVAGLFIGGLVLLGLLIANQKTRALGIALSVLCGVMLLGLFSAAFFMNVSYERASMARDQAMAEAEDERSRAIAEAAFDELTKPRITLEQDDPNAAEGDASGDPSRVAVETADGKFTVLSTDAPPPAWVERPPIQPTSGNKTIAVIESGPYGEPSECLRVEGLELAAVARRYVRDSVADSPSIDQLGMSTSELVQRFVTARHMSKEATSIMDVYTLHSLVEIDDQGGEQLVLLTLQESRTQKLRKITLLAGGVLTLIAGAFGLLKLDEATRGYYTKRLLIGVPVALVSTLWLLSLMR